ncbi:MAG TPA: glycoside hydrolase family 88 protein [Cyclobacteriaceae bacterium]|nr:glycoside hydrolase family 88 protein [Cyclobacteriaceae bacterium]
MKSVLAILLLLITDIAIGQSFIVTRNYRTRPEKEKAIIVLDWQKLHAQSGDFDIMDNNFGRKIPKKIIDSNKDRQPDAVVIDYTFESDEPVYSFSVKANNQDRLIVDGTFTPDPRLAVTYLTKKEVENWPDKIIESTMAFYPEPPATYSHEFAYFLTAMFQRWQETKKPEYFTYIKKWCDRFIDSHGSFNPKYYNVADYRLDDLLGGRLYVSLYEVTKDSKYKGAADQLKQQLRYQPRTTDGAYWHNQVSPYQVWIEGSYMADVFSMQYAKTFNEPSMFNEAMQHIRLIEEHNRDAGTGLLYHGWDESGNNVWANEESGTSPEFWSRGIGWYMMALLECIDYIPLESLDRKEVGPLFSQLAKAVAKYQDPKTGLWYQVINKSYEPRNWHETSATAMFAYAFAKGYRKGILDKTCLAAAQKAFDAIRDKYVFFDDEGRLYFDGVVKVGSLNVKTSKGDLDYYVSVERRVNDYKGLGSLLYLAMELD